MIYTWQCGACGHTEEITRTLADIDLGPQAPCKSCNEHCFDRVMAPRPKSVKGFILVDSGCGWPHHGYYNKPPERS